MIRSVFSVVAGSLCWGVLWVTMNGILQTIIPDIARGDGRVDNVAVLGLFLVVSIILSIIAGYLTAWLIGKKEFSHTVALGILQLAVGILVQIQYLDLMPIWYHVLFLLFLIPGNVYGGQLRLRYKYRTRQAIVQTT
jgi:hypothetical protein